MSILTEAEKRISREYEPGEVIISEDEIAERIAVLAGEIGERYTDQQLLLVGILKGSVHTTVDLSRALHRVGLTDSQMTFMTLSSYGSGTESSGKPTLTQDLDIDPAGRHVLMIDDIFDTGHTFAKAAALLEEKKVASVAGFALLHKPSRREVEFQPDYIGFEVKDWVQGYGMDTAEFGRGNPDIIKGPYPTSLVEGFE